MTFIQRAEVCTEHPNCCVILGLDDGRRVWDSHMSNDVHPEHRINMDHPVLQDARSRKVKQVPWSLTCDDCMEPSGWTDEERRRVAHHAARQKVGTAAELAAVARTTPDELAAEAKAKRW